MAMSNLSEVNNTTSCCNGGHPFSDEIIIWLYNESLFDNINFPCVIYLIILSILGIFGNSLVIYIYGFTFKKTNAHFFILSLAVLDNMCSFAMIFEVFDKRFPMYIGNYRILCKITRFAELFGSVSSSMLLLCIALDRYYKICKPFRSFSSRKARKSLIVSVGVGVILSWPMLLFHGPETIETGVQNVLGSDCADDNNFKDSVLPSIYFGFLGVLNMVVIVLLSFMYIRIFRAILRWKRKQIGETIIPPSPVSTVSMNYRISRIKTWIKRSRRTKYIQDSKKSNNFVKAETIDGTSDSNQSNEECELKDCGNGKTNQAFGSDHHHLPRGSVDNPQHKRHGSEQNNDFRRGSLFSVDSHRKTFKSSKVVTTNTVLFSIVTIIYIISYIPTICVETLNAANVYKERELSDSTRSILVILNVTYFLNSIANQFVYSAVNPSFRKQIKNIFIGT